MKKYLIWVLLGKESYWGADLGIPDEIGYGKVRYAYLDNLTEDQFLSLCGMFIKEGQYP